MKNNKKKHHRSKASKKRRAACEANPEIKRRHKSGKRNKKSGKPEILITDIGNEEAPTIGDMPVVIPADSLGSAGKPGWMSVLLARYLNSLIERLMNGEQVEAYSLVSFSFSHSSDSEFQAKPRIIGSGSFCFPVKDVLQSDVSEFCLYAEQGVRDYVARLNESDDNTIQVVVLEAEGTTEFIDVEASKPHLCDANVEIAETYVDEISISPRS